MSFKLLAIRPLEGCNKDFLKNLEENRIYKFYNDYNFYIEDKESTEAQAGEITKIEYKPINAVPENLYDQGNTKINISAIVGKNGSGKSTLVELLYAFFYQLSLSEGIIEEFDFSKVIDEKYRKEEQFDFLNLKEYSNKYKIFDKEEDYLIFKEEIEKKYNECLSSIEHKENDLDITKKNEIILQLKNWKYYFDNKLYYFLDNLFVEIYYKSEDIIYKLLINEEKINKVFLTKLKGNHWIKCNIKDNIFYNIVINYSLYGLNSIILGDWISRVFHKNDGYDAPIVINPYREEGIIDPNKEMELAKDRLLSNILRKNENLKLLINGKKVVKLSLKIKERKYLNKYLSQNKKKYLELYLKDILNAFKICSNESDIDEKKTNEIINSKNQITIKATDYILYKLQKISKVYSKENTSFKEINYDDDNTINPFLNNIKDHDHGSHITFKLRQVVNFLKYNLYPKKKSITFEYKKTNELSNKIDNILENLIKDYSKEKNEKDDPTIAVVFPYWLLTNMSLIPPAIYDVDYEFEDFSKFSTLSSGETQQIFSISSIIYHLINLNSKLNSFLFFDKKLLKENFIKSNTLEKDNKYNDVNIILDEIELYAHPEMQRTFINNLLEKIRLTFLNYNFHINILFITHSPFILSDIPKQNVLFLEVDKTTKKALPKDYKEMNTFGANITDLLADSFFIGNGLIGEYAKEKIEESIKWMNQILEKRKEIRKLELEDNKNNYSVIEELKNDLETLTIDELNVNKDNKKYKKFHKTINLIDENFLRVKLLEMYNEALPIENERKKELELLEKLAKKHKKNISDA